MSGGNVGWKVKDPYTSSHCKRVAMYATHIGEAMGLENEMVRQLHDIGLLHDVGKLITPDAILLKPHKYRGCEFTIMKNHASDGARILTPLVTLAHYNTVIRHHHEPDGIKGSEIPFLARIISVADAFDAMTTNRIYRVSRTAEEAVEELIRCSGTQFDPHVVSSASDALLHFEEEVHIAQHPKNYIDEERFAYYFKDILTGFYTSEYLSFFLQHNEEPFRCCYFIQLHHMKEYNVTQGWRKGDELLKELALRLRIFFDSTHIFRLFGDDFVVLNSEHKAINETEVLQKLLAGFPEVDITLKHFDLKAERLSQWEAFERHIGSL